MPHVHGVLWSDFGPEVEQAFKAIFSGEFEIEDNNYKQVIDTIDKLISCSSDTGDDELDKIVSEVQIHHHTKTCRKKNQVCRFQFPRFPSCQTIIAKPPTGTEEEVKKTLMWAKAILKSVKEVLLSEDFDQTMSIEELCTKAKVNIKDYHKALTVSEKGNVIVYKRSVRDIFVNNYNKEILRAWNGNMDIQATMDQYAIVTYVTDYYSKVSSLLGLHVLCFHLFSFCVLNL